ncbi:MAG: S41 family peptidase [Bacteroidota bacterium]
MKHLLLTLALFIPFSLFSQNQEAYFTENPTLSPNGKIIIFSYDSDLWQVSKDGGLAVRITALDGNETHPRISPDGKWLAFTSTQYGNSDVFIMPLGGGDIKQLTYHQGSDVVSNWTWDSQSVLFTSSRLSRINTYEVNINGGTPKYLFNHYFNNLHNVAIHPSTGDIYFNESWESNNFANRKRYKGAFNPNIKTYNPETKEYKEHTTYDGKDFDVTIDRNGTVYFLSDEYNGEYNLYTFDNGKKKRLTKFETAIWEPFVSADGSTIVFHRDYQLYTFDTKSKRSKKVEVLVNRNKTLAKEQTFNTRRNVSDFDVSSDGKKFAFVSRGELFVSDIGGKYVKQLATRTDGRVMEVYWLEDDKSLIFSQTVGGYQNWFTISADGTGKEKQLTSDNRNNRFMAMNSDRSKAVYFSGRDEVRLIDLESFESSLLAKDELWGFQNSRPHFAFDDKHVVYNAKKNFETEIYLINIDTKEKSNLSNTAVSENAPVISPDGSYLYFVSNPTQASYPYGLRDANIYRTSLQRRARPFKSNKFDELFAEKEKKEKKDTTEKEEEKPMLEIDMDGLMDRATSVGVTFGTQNPPYVIHKGDKVTLLYTSNHDEGSYKMWKTVLEPFERPKTTAIKGATAFGLNIKTAKNKYYTIIRGNITEINLGGNSTKAIEINHSFRRNLNDEFNQMYYETWANLEENFYNETFHGINWSEMRDRYAAYLPYVNNRQNLRKMTNDLLGELNTSHFGFSTFGREESTYYGTTSLATGILFQNQDPYRVDRIVKESPADYPDLDIKKGDRLIAVNDNRVDSDMNREMYFNAPAREDEIKLTFERAGSEFDVKIHPTSYFTVRNLIYDEWEDQCQEKVDEMSNKRIAYVHMKNMGGGELQKFLKEMVSEGQQRDALILDLRWNTGGNVHDNVLRFLSQKTYLNWKYREGELTNQSNFNPANKPIILMTNEQSLSDAEMTAAGFKELGLGKILGTETYRWIIFTSGKGLVDGSFYRLPSWGCYTLGGDNLERTGVAPDIYVRETFEDRLNGRDPQLDMAIAEILKQL